MSIYNNQSVAVLGLSVEGIDVTRYFSGEKASVTCCDMRTESELGATYGILRGYTDKFRLGADYLTGLDHFDIIVRSPGVSPGLPELVALKKKGKLITSLTQLFFEHCKASIIGVTGTKGKGTTSTLIYEMLKEDGKKVWLGGNVGVPLLSSVPRFRKSDIVILELSSFQLEDCTKSPHIAVVLKTTQEHLANFDPLATNYHTSRDAYVAAKQSIVRYQTKGDFAILNADDPTSSSFASLTGATLYYFSRKDSTRNAYVQDNSVYLTYDGKRSVICNLTETHLRGLHNLENIAAASLAASVAGAGIGSIQKVARTFEGLPHRLQSVRIVDGVLFVDDSFSTTPETTIAAISSFDTPKILILGGSEKGSDFTQLGKEISANNVPAVIIIGQMTRRIRASLKRAGYTGVTITGLLSMHDVVSACMKAAKSGDTVILSPACASFDMFKNYKERGDQFAYEVNHI